MLRPSQIPKTLNLSISKLSQHLRKVGCGIEGSVSCRDLCLLSICATISISMDGLAMLCARRSKDRFWFGDRFGLVVGLKMGGVWVVLFPTGSIAFILETGSKRINTPPDIVQLALARDTNDYPHKVVKLMLDSTGKVWSTIYIKPEEVELATGELTAEDLVNIMKLYSNLNQKE